MSDLPQALYEDILESHPTHYRALHALGVIEGRKNNWVRAAELLGRAVAVNPLDASAHCDRGVAFKGLKQWQAALACYDRAIALRADYAEAHSNRGNVLRDLQQFEAALASYDRAIALRADYAEAHYNRGVVLHDLHRLPPALASYDRAIAVKPDYARAHCNRGVVLEQLDQLEAALASYDRAIAIKSDYAQAYSNRGNTLRALNRVDAAIESCNQALALDPQHAAAHQNRGIALLLAGDFANGWIDYEWRWRNPNSPLAKDARTFPQPRWQGREPLAGKTILIYSEQGLGDTLQFCRYVPMVVERGARVILEVQKPLERLLAGLAGVAELVPRGAAPPDFDCHCALLSLPLAFGTTASSIPRCVPYLSSEVDKTLYWRDRLRENRKFKVGLVWSGGFRPEQPEPWSVNNRRNIPLAKLAPLKHPKIEFYSLQKGQPAESEPAALMAGHWDGPRLIDFTHELQDFSDTAALMANLDLLISVDTSTAHLAGALGKPVWILSRFDGCWRWLLDRTDTPWYPTARLYRQDRPGDWDGVVRRLGDDLHALLESA
jgi:tetratricopeptide (TPR) repeat protein